jgi:hypothetical protein
VDKFKLLKLHRRPLPERAKDIGTWAIILNTTSIIAIFTNSAIFCFTAPTFNNFEQAKQNPFIPSLILCFLLIGFRGWIAAIIPDIPGNYTKVLHRHDHIVDKYIKGWLPLKKQVDDE